MTNKLLLAGLAIAAASTVTASEYALAEDEPTLMMRSGPGSAFEIPVGSSWSSKTPDLNNDGRAAMSINLVPPQNHAGVWSGTVDGGGIVDIAEEGSALYTDVGINDAGEIVWVRNESDSDGILRYDPDSDQTEYLTNAPLGASGWTSIEINNAGELGYRAAFGFSGNAWVSYSEDDGDAIHLAEDGVDSSSPYAFAFSPSINDHRVIAGKAAYQTTTTNRIVIADADGNVEILVEDNELDKDSPFSNFNNSVGFNNAGQVAFIGSLVAGGQGVYLVDGDGWTQYAIEGEDGLDDLEFFAPQLNNAGQIVFRGFDDQGRRAVWRADGESVVAVATEDDVVATDLGQSRLQSPDSVGGPNFGGSPALNDNGDIAFVSLLTHPDDTSQSHGRGLFLVPGEAEEPVGELTLTKTADPVIFDSVDQVIEYVYEVENTGDAIVAGPVSVDDDQEKVTCPGGDLEPEFSITCTAERTITQEDLDAGSVTNTAQASADGLESNTAVVTIVTPDIFEDRFEAPAD